MIKIKCNITLHDLVQSLRDVAILRFHKSTQFQRFPAIAMDGFNIPLSSQYFGEKHPVMECLHYLSFNMKLTYNLSCNV